jgi:PRTRC genetic system ThiF family protein
MDLGNRASDGQYLIGCPCRPKGNVKARLPTVLEAFPELADETLAEDDAPSCSVAEALERQSLFVNRVLASHALALLFDLLGRGSIGHAGAFINLASGQAVPILCRAATETPPATPPLSVPIQPRWPAPGAREILS